MKKIYPLLFFCCSILILPSCSFKSIALNITADLFEEGQSAFEEEGDLQLAEQSMGANLKVLEALLKSSPDHEGLLVLLSKSYGGYSFAFIEDAYDELKTENETKSSFHKERASRFYLRARDFSFKVLKEDADFKHALQKDFSTFEKSLEGFDREDVPALFWTAYNWGNWINLNLHSPAAIADAPRVERLMNRVLNLDENYFFAGSHIFYGVYYGGRPSMLGGNPSKARNHFEKALKLTKRKILITQVLYAQYYALPTGNEELFEGLLGEVIKADDQIYPEQNLITQIAKKKARRLLARKSDLF